ncbi:MAG: hypothetical protein ACI8UO_004258 [Verrucomicrobiales bacterium]|jgi:hypothetical protein
MKTSPLLALSVLAVLFASASPARAENIIRQTLLDSGIVYDLFTDLDSGNAISNHPLSGGGACYELFARGTAWDTNLYFLDKKVVGFYLPQGAIQVHSEDLWTQATTGIPTTRADKPFTLSITISGLTDDHSAPHSARHVLYTRVGQNFTESYVPEGNPEYTIASFHMDNAAPNFTPVYTLLTPMAPTKAMGIERFTLSSLPDETIPAASILDEARVLVWPVSEASFEGIADGTTIRDNLPRFSVIYKDLYPVSLTYAKIYPGSPVLGAGGTTINGSIRWHWATVPQNEVITVDNWENLIPEDGIYTIEVLHMTPFDNWATERLSTVTFDVNRKITVRGQVTTMEK